ncbi:MAG TPA: glycine cleavage system protein GcvH [Acidimicrobiia bacterium]|nr:glycine cleavage system protein GcvH [Acidimicrobiia bacterium]
MLIPEDLIYTEEHEWLRPGQGGTFRVGITDYAQDQLGDIVFVDLPEVGASVDAGGLLAEVESTKSVGEVYAPVAGTVTAVNESVAAQPETINSDPYGEGWLVEMEPTDPLPTFLDAAAYRALIE